MAGVAGNDRDPSKRNSRHGECRETGLDVRPEMELRAQAKACAAVFCPGEDPLGANIHDEICP